MKRNKFSNWREDLIEVVDVPSSEPKTDKKSERKIDTKEVKNKIVINPQMTEAFNEIGATILEVTELDEKLSPEDLKRMQDEKDKKEGRKPGKVEEENMSALQMKRAREEQKIARIDMKIARERKKSTQAPEQVQERTLSSDEKEEKERIVKGMKKSKGGFEKRYGDDAKSVMYATATKLAKEEVELEEGRAEDAQKSLDAVKKRQKVLDAHEKKTGTKLDISKSPEHKAHKQNFPGAKRTPKKVRGAKETSSEKHNRRVQTYIDRLKKYGKTSKQKRDDEAMAKHTSPRD